MRVTGREEAAPAARPTLVPRERTTFDDALERTVAPAPGPAAAPRPPAFALPELREAARAVPPAIWSGQVGRAGAVELSFGSDLAVEVRQAAGGVEVSVRSSPALARAARLDLSALVATLRERGVTVVRAEVRCGRGDRAATPRRPSR